MADVDDRVGDFPQLTLTQVEDVAHLLDGLTAVPIINGFTVDEMAALIPVLIALTQEAKHLEDLSEEAGFPLDEEAKRLGSAVRVYIQGPGGAQVRTDVARVVDPDGTLVLDTRDVSQMRSEIEVDYSSVTEMFKDGWPKPEVTE